MKPDFQWLASWTMAQAKREFSMCSLKAYRLERHGISSGWYVIFKETDGLAGPLVNARENSPRLFKTLDAAVVALEQVGFVVEMLAKG